MNKRLQELLTQSTYNIMGIDQVDQKQFAELIVKECSIRLSELGNPELGKGILKHFGVEE